jgi:hypothetical protein
MHEHVEYPDTEHPGVPYTGYRDPHEQTGSDDETDTVQTFHEGDLVQVVQPGAYLSGHFASVVYTDGGGDLPLHLRFVLAGDERVLAYSPDELKLIRAAEKPGWERHGMVRNCHRWRMWKGEIGWTAVQPFQCEGPLFRTGYGYGDRSYRRVHDELELAILKGKAALHLQEVLS